MELVLDARRLAARAKRIAGVRSFRIPRELQVREPMKK
jgi:hypothetical protein